MLNCIRNGNFAMVILDSEVILQTTECDDEFFSKIENAENDDELLNLFYPERVKKIREVTLMESDLNKIKDCPLLSYDEVLGIVTCPSICSLSMPFDLAIKIADASNNLSDDKLTAYINFWTLLCLNPDPLCRENLYKFLNKWGMVISKSGLIVGYRNADLKTSNPYVREFTDHHSHKFTIKVGEMVTMPREACDTDSHVSCSRGLHIGGTTWLNQCYYGDTGLVCLVNPVDVVAVPFDDETYGKLRCCAYLPVAEAQYNEAGKIIPYYTEDGFDAPYTKKIIYDGIFGTEDDPTYSIKIPTDIPEINTAIITANILELARRCMK